MIRSKPIFLRSLRHAAYQTADPYSRVVKINCNLKLNCGRLPLDIFAYLPKRLSSTMVPFSSGFGFPSRRAKREVAPVYGWFTEGFDTRDLKEAKSLLEDLER